MDITRNQPITSPAQNGLPPANTNAESGTAISSDFETFIKMLTVQVENQDPLNPTDGADFAVQLATFSSVEQQVLTNDLLSDLGAQFGAQSIAQLSGWVGMEARAEIPVSFEGSPVEISLQNEDLAQSAQLVVLNNQGTEIQRLDVPASSGDFLWEGKDSFGNLLPSGTYTLSTESFAQDELIASNPVAVYERITEVRNDTGRPSLIMESGQEVLSDQVLGLRELPR